jgi:hypothetical protein
MGFVGFATAGIANQFINGTIEPIILSILPGILGEALVSNSFFITAMITFSIVFTVYDGFLWRVFSDYLRGESVPNLQGIWIQVPADEDAESIRKRTVTQIEEGEYNHPLLVISQNWTEMELGYLNPTEAYWRSDSAMIRVEDAPHPELICTFQYEQLDDSLEMERLDRGTLRLRHVKEGDRRLIGHAYTESGKQQRGLTFVRAEKRWIPPTIRPDAD